MNRLAWSITLIFGAAIALYLPVWLEEEEQVIFSDTDEALIPNYEAKNLRTKIFDKNGRLTHRVNAAKMEHFDQLDYVNFIDPQYTIYLEESGKRWQLNASEGTFIEGDRIQLSDDVTITSLQVDDYVQTISTEFIEIQLQTKSLSSDQPVVISGANFIINSIGFEGNIATQQYELSKHVQTEYLPAR
ncbi:LPS export ABC transporter periplasmic protein LptC [Glaciecola sp. MH2013]|uniref:LPS export ABC transporter periplasmic protein LptC n=1 Tax=Glaciecola sp. MH2013 TaxID=2785524 RepID=UPI00189EB815|nr:LPS export ABC transporter periplasmic protein LptC [Glaciecola sp. MH2013]MBF7074913.1 LPS export ABC transporter periplasmic protein LptC [Glaciecola sp. MH2013]